MLLLFIFLLFTVLVEAASVHVYILCFVRSKLNIESSAVYVCIQFKYIPLLVCVQYAKKNGRNLGVKFTLAYVRRAPFLYFCEAHT